MLASFWCKARAYNVAVLQSLAHSQLLNDLYYDSMYHTNNPIYVCSLILSCYLPPLNSYLLPFKAEVPSLLQAYIGHPSLSGRYRILYSSVLELYRKRVLLGKLLDALSFWITGRFAQINTASYKF